VELVGRHLYSHIWTGREHFHTQPVDSPQEIAAKREPLEKLRDAATAELLDIENAILATTNAKEISRLMVRRKDVEWRSKTLNTQIFVDHPLNDGVIETYKSFMRQKRATETLLDAIRKLEVKVHDGRGRPLNHSVWTDNRFRFYIELSIVINSTTAGGPRRQAARIDRKPFEDWLKAIPRIVEPIALPEPEVRTTPEKQCKLLIINWINSGRVPINRNAAWLEAKEQISGLSERAFQRAWAESAPDSWKRRGRRAKK
jgi:hypothetical protein